MVPQILFENSDVICIDKPAGLISHPNESRNEFSVSQWAVDYYPDIRNVGESIVLEDGTIIERHGIVHRLDRGTSGVMVLAKNQVAHQILKKQFSEGSIAKEYCAFVYGRVRDERGIITAPIGRDRNVGVRKATRKATGTLREARTEYVVEDSIPSSSFVYFYPKTGRTHQIRIHAKHIRHPIVGDTLYAHNMDPLFGFERLALHAKSISFLLPHTTIPFECSTVFPEDFKTAYLALEKEKR